ncbi:MAG: hypothetical protein QOF84_7321 [Streptomyces sp.]|jgi:murein DD-endopeptidase MepM/ murein hydrolase activator NlpD|nr:hypothetical protein [Streptomyces sp.]MDX6352531.1 hypothetical protein [Streptomyces sp.]
MALTIRTTLACAAALAATVTTGAAAAQAQAADTTAFTRVATVTDSLATHIAAQADAQHKAADAAKQKAAAEAKAKQEREAKAAKAKAQAAAAAKQRAARASRSAGVRKSLTGWMKPVNSSISTPYHATSSLWASGYHTGADFIASTGTPVHAVGPATVVEAGWGGSYGNNVILRMSDGMYVLYGHLSSIGVSVGQTVSAGQQLGLSGATGNVTGPHLHFEVRTTQSYGSDVDPVAYLRKHGVTV